MFFIPIINFVKNVLNIYTIVVYERTLPIFIFIFIKFTYFYMRIKKN